jgi:hypothetical protein
MVVEPSTAAYGLCRDFQHDEGGGGGGGGELLLSSGPYGDSGATQGLYNRQIVNWLCFHCWAFPFEANTVTLISSQGGGIRERDYQDGGGLRRRHGGVLKLPLGHRHHVELHAERRK